MPGIIRVDLAEAPFVREHPLAFCGKNERGELVRRGRCRVHQGQSVIGADRKRVGKNRDLLLRILLLNPSAPVQ